MSANNITQKCQKTAKAFLDTVELSFINDTETQIVEGIASSDMMLPAVVCQCQQATASVAFEGNWAATLRIEVRSNADDTTQDEHHDRAGEVFGVFMTSRANYVVNMSNATIGFTCQELIPMEQGWELNDDSWVSYLVLQVECAGTYFDVS